MGNRLYKRGQTYYAQFYDLNGKRITRTTGCGDRKAAEAKLREFERRAADPDHAAANEATVGQALNNMMRDRRLKGRAQGTLDSYAVKAGHVLRLLGENTVLAQVNARMVDAFIDKRLAEGAKRNTIGKELTVLRGALKVAKRRGEFPRDIAAVMPDGFSTDYKPKERYLPKHEALALLGELAPDRAARVAFIIATGARWGESERAEPGDIDLGQQVVRLRGTKTKASARFVPIVGDDARKLLEHAMRYADGSGGAAIPTVGQRPPRFGRSVRARTHRSRDAQRPPAHHGDLVADGRGGAPFDWGHAGPHGLTHGGARLRPHAGGRAREGAQNEGREPFQG